MTLSCVNSQDDRAISRENWCYSGTFLGELKGETINLGLNFSCRYFLAALENFFFGTEVVISI